ncbi:putative calcineurin A [Monocercomonoides exilis]|uniref:putative calcineurin A n=1 Tax=Monocercomonoides exilis TaxID=2049356 RepID=UPI00355981E5|nr:putative calcineurin A [Monocercomonoides exilis]|eukprot:MONOS_4364.1-p1 / transcript=MONOS_4364.1 / gene=MONOS_4364 / organism=Monocercomonoides_exilis_PA203 / gene_product=calcineurin A / transcript_product=calcineurin A / location=Mono_scaffold00115:52129-54527(-) / protein_length=598 / sequence_SO=supercontig / SO=protein_coding / is_pseudo=false
MISAPAVDIGESFDTISRPCSDVPEPAKDILDHSVLFMAPNKINIPALKEHFVREGRINISDITTIVNMAAQIFRTEPNVLDISGEVRVAGDLHGSYYDFLKLLEVGGDPSEFSYLFLGDYVDRGFFGCELLIHMLALKINYPTSFFMIRGNHESKHLTEHFNFKRECIYKYNSDVYYAFLSVFDTMPFAALIGEKRFFCVHAGISPQLKKIDALNGINRFREIPDTGMVTDMLWSDPVPAELDPSNTVTFIDNSARNCSYYYGATAVRQFLRANSLVALVRGHECKDTGFEMQFPRSGTNPFPTVITLFSCPNYVDSFKNQAAILLVKKEKIHFRQFSASPHPYFLPNFIDVFHLSLPYVAENIASMLLEILKFCSTPGEGEDKDTSLAARRGEITTKIHAVARLCGMFQTLRQENEAVVLLKGFSDGTLQKGLLLGGKTAIREALSSFQRAMEVDKPNLARPSPKSDSAAEKAAKELAYGSSSKEKEGGASSSSTPSSSSSSSSSDGKKGEDDEGEEVLASGRKRVSTYLRRLSSDQQLKAPLPSPSSANAPRVSSPSTKAVATRAAGAGEKHSESFTLDLPGMGANEEEGKQAKK